MPYISCDGKIYSRYDSSEYVKECIKKEHEYYIKKHEECMEIPACKEKYESQQQFIDGFIVFSVAISIVCLCIFMYQLFKICNNDRLDNI